ncbi:MAG: cupin domain-containing protein [Spirosomataceae bacterium]
MQLHLPNRRQLLQQLSAIMIGTALDITPSEGASLADEKAVYIPSGTGLVEKFGGIEMVFKLSKAQTHGSLGSEESILQPGFMGAPPHLHQTFDEITIVLEGSVTILVGDEVTVVKAGDWHLRPRQVMHCFWNADTKPARYIDLFVPGGHEAYLQDLARLFHNNGRPTPDDFARLEKTHDIQYFWNKLPEIMKKYNVHL